MKNYIQSKFIGYEPNKNAAISTVWVWEPLGCCTGTLSPTPNPAGLWEDVGGCFCEYDETITYVAGDKISKRKYGSQVIYQCKGAPMDQFCSMTVSKCYTLSTYNCVTISLLGHDMNILIYVSSSLKGLRAWI